MMEQRITMKRSRSKNKHRGNSVTESAVSSLIEYLIISGILMLLIIITVLSITPVAIDNPTNQLTEYAFIDIGNGVSTRLVDVFVIAPEGCLYPPYINCEGHLTTKFDIPDDIVGKGYFVDLEGSGGDVVVSVSRDMIQRNVSIAGIGYTVPIGGSTTGQGLNEICYDTYGNC